MKKKLLLIGTAAAVIAPVVSMVACSVNNYGKNFEYWGKIQTVTDAGSVADKSFNQSAFEATRDYSQDINTDNTFGYAQPKETTKALLQKAYLSAIQHGAKRVVLPGFTHSDVTGGDAVKFAIAHHKAYPDVKYISPDGFYEKNDVAVNNGFYNLSYAAQESGFLAAVYSGMYFNEVMKVTEPIKVAAFGGIAIPIGVTSYLDGFLQGIQWFNDNNDASQQDEHIDFLGGNKPSESDFTGSFDAGGATSKVTTLLTEKKSQVILPVAGPQTGDVIGGIQTNGLIGKSFALGVDTDQSIVYGSSSLLGSAIKGVYSSTLSTLKDLDSNTTINSSFDKARETTDKAKLDEMRIGLKASGKYTDNEIENRLKYTGFVPASSEGAVIQAEELYKDALVFIEGEKNGLPNLAPGSITKQANDGLANGDKLDWNPAYIIDNYSNDSNAAKAFANYGSFMNVAKGVKNA